jgi:hypothetical protein
MQDFLKPANNRGVGQRHFTQLLSIKVEHPVNRMHGLRNKLPDRLQSSASRRLEGMNLSIRIENRHARFFQHPGDGAFSHPHATGQPKYFHSKSPSR